MRLLALVIVAAVAGVAHAESDFDNGLAALDVEAYRDRPILVGELTSKLQWLTLFETNPTSTHDALIAALSHHGFHAADASTTAHDAEADAAALLAERRDLGGVLLFQLEGRWGKPHVHVWLRMRSGNAADIDLDPPNDGLVTLAPWRIGVLAAVILVPIALLGMLSRRRQKVVPLEHQSRVQPLVPRAKPDESIPLSAGNFDLAPAIAPEPPKPIVMGKRDSIALLGSAATPARIRERYRVMSELGRGAMGVVYRAYDENLEREVAVKVMSEQLRDHPQALKLFASEGKMLAQLNHPNIIAIYDQIGDRDEAMLVMELVEGIPLDRALAKCERYGWRGALQIVDQLCAALAYAHEKNVIHRDIKPPNIFITTKGDVKLGDFGLARVMRALAVRSTELRGTPMYMAPEQITGAALDQRVDLYAVGCTLFELLTGRPVFVEGDPMFQHVSTPPPNPAELVPGLPSAVAELVTALIAKSPDDRPPSAEAVRARIAVILA